MANEFVFQYFTGKTLYFVVIDNTDKIWNGSSFVTINTANWATYKVAMTELSSAGIYNGNFPVSIVSAGRYKLIFYEQLTGTPASSDLAILSGIIDWTGTEEVGTASLDVSLIANDVSDLKKMIQAKVERFSI